MEIDEFKSKMLCDVCQAEIDGTKGVGVVLRRLSWEMSVCGNCLLDMGSNKNVRNDEEGSPGKGGILEDGNKT